MAQLITRARRSTSTISQYVDTIYMFNKTSSRIKLIISIIAISSATFALFGGLSSGYSLPSIVCLSVAGALFGAILAPEIAPKAFRYPTLWQISFSTLGCLSIATLLNADIEGYALAVIIGIISGYFASIWINHIQLP